MSVHFESGLDLVEILGEFIGDDERISGHSRLDRIIAGDDLVGAAMQYPGGMARGYASPQAKRAAFARNLQAAIAQRRADAGALLHERAPTKSREYPLGFVSTTAVAAGASARITTRPQVPFRIDRLVVPSDIAGLFTIDDVKVGKNSQFAAEGSVPARIFQENGVGVCLKGDTAQISMDVTLSVTNISGAAATFRAAIIGPAVE